VELLTALIAVVAVYIAWQQWQTNDLRLRHELFERRYKQYEATRACLGTVMAQVKVTREAEIRWLEAIQGARFILDEEVADYFDTLREKVAAVRAFVEDMEGKPPGDELTKLSEGKRATFDWLEKEWQQNLEERLAPYLELKHRRIRDTWLGKTVVDCNAGLVEKG